VKGGERNIIELLAEYQNFCKRTTFEVEGNHSFSKYDRAWE